MTLVKVLFACALALLLAWGNAVPAAAHGGSVWVDNDYGAYHLVVATGPGVPPNSMIVTVIVMTKETATTDRQVVKGATVTATLQLTGTTALAAPLIVPIPAEPTLADFGYYEHTFPLPPDGDYSMAVAVNSPIGPVAVTFPLSLRQPSPQVQDVTWAIAVVPILIALIALAYVWRRSRRVPVVSGQGPVVRDE